MQMRLNLFVAYCLISFLLSSSVLLGEAAREKESRLTISASVQETGAPASGGREDPEAMPIHAAKLIVIGFMGGNVSASSRAHREGALTRKLQAEFPKAVEALIYANRDGKAAFARVVELLGGKRDGSISDGNKAGARIVIFGHSWGASETINLANRLNRLGVPVLLTVQVDSVQKRNQDDARIPPNVREAVNFYQTEGLLRGRTAIVAEDPGKTRI